MAQTAEAMGHDSLWFVDHLLYAEGATADPPQGVREDWSVLVGLAAVTDDAACRDVGRDPATLERTASMVDLVGRRAIPASMGPNTATPVTGTPDEIAEAIRAFVALGVSHLQMYLLPNSVAGLRAFEPVLRALGRA